MVFFPYYDIINYILCCFKNFNCENY